MANTNIDIKKLEADLTGEEGRRRCAYRDSLGIWTIGIGRNIDEAHGGGLSDLEIDFLFQNDINKKMAALYIQLPWIRKLSEPRQRALMNMAFQMGIVGLCKFTGTLAALEAGQWQTAVDHAMDSLWARQTPNRAKLVTALFLQD